ncbi:hypothetical protein M758_10G004700 [Ceratodon purpureus]|uniref:Uncharacterized protein n=1 Tax=Ceratodon purpureus TaxID=3225 RepID=A0A8T0GGH5_CERPU|nr:hypothetical protein KC19_10G005600 [Ceratodon purpureus]KAG0602296.1 hypothetical protein M758_10G004700 [Ceratodon purpureus]
MILRLLSLWSTSWSSHKIMIRLSGRLYIAPQACCHCPTCEVVSDELSFRCLFSNSNEPSSVSLLACEDRELAQSRYWSRTVRGVQVSLMIKRPTCRLLQTRVGMKEVNSAKYAYPALTLASKFVNFITSLSSSVHIPRCIYSEQPG